VLVGRLEGAAVGNKDGSDVGCLVGNGPKSVVGMAVGSNGHNQGLSAISSFCNAQY